VNEIANLSTGRDIMKEKIHWSIGDWEDSIVIEGETEEELNEEADYVVKSRGLDVEKNNLWSEKITR
jgi:hypothetical protein